MTVGFGIDLGTTRTSIALVTPYQPNRGWYGGTEVLALVDGTVTPSAVLFDDDSQIVGMTAKNMGHRAADCAQVFKREMPNIDYFFAPASGGGMQYSAEDLSQIMLENVTAQARERSGLDVSQVVITVPAYFGDVERRRTRQAGEKAGLTILDIVNEPTAAILAYLFQPGAEVLKESVLVFDLGGGTFDTVVVDVQEHSIEVVAIDGDLLLGGRDFDSTIAFELAIRYAQEYPGATLPTADPDASARLMLEVERARETLSAVRSVSIPVWGAGADAGKSLTVQLTRSEMERLLETQLQRCVDIARRALDTAAGTGVEPTRVLFVGGTTKMPVLRQRVQEEFNLTELTSGADPDLLVAKGAALWAQKLLFEQAARAKLSRTSLAGVAWDSTEAKSVITQLASESTFSRDVVTRLLQTSLQSVTSHGYAIRCFTPERDEYHLAYLVDANQPLPYSSEPELFWWNKDIDAWELKLYEDTADYRGTRDPDMARHVETIHGETHRRWAKDSEFFVQIEMSADQVIQLHAWHKEGDVPGGELRATINPVQHERVRAKTGIAELTSDVALEALRRKLSQGGDLSSRAVPERLASAEELAALRRKLSQGADASGKTGQYRLVFGQGATVAEAMEAARRQLDVATTDDIEFEILEGDRTELFGVARPARVRAKLQM